MKICLISKECFPFYYGGIGSTFYALGRMLSQLGHEVVLLSKKPHNANEFTISDHYTGSFQLIWIEYVEGQLFTHNRLDYAYQLESFFERFNEKFKANLVLIPEFDGEGYFLLKAKKDAGKYPQTTIITHFSGPLFALYKSINRRSSYYEQIIFKIEEYSIRASDFSIAPSTFIWEHLNKHFSLKHQTNFIYPNPVNPAVFKEPVRTMQEPGKEQNILFIGRLQDIKGADYLIEAFADLVNSRKELNVKLQFIGSDLYWDEYGQSFIEYWKEHLPPDVLARIEFTGVLTHPEIFERLSKAWVAVFPSRFETFGNVALEAMYSNVPVIVNKDTGLAAVIGEKYKFYWKEAHGIDALSKKLYEIISDSQLHQELKEQVYSRAKELHDNKEPLISSIIKKIGSAKPATKHPQDLTALEDEIFLLANLYAAELVNTKNEEIRNVYQLKDDELKKAWEEYDKKNEELKNAWEEYDKKNVELKEVWGQYDKKNEELQEVWKQNDKKDQELQQAYLKHESDVKNAWTEYDKKNEELKELWGKFDQKNEELQQIYSKHETEIKNSWEKYNEKDVQLAAT